MSHKPDPTKGSGGWSQWRAREFLGEIRAEMAIVPDVTWVTVEDPLMSVPVSVAIEWQQFAMLAAYFLDHVRSKRTRPGQGQYPSDLDAEVARVADVMYGAIETVVRAKWDDAEGSIITGTAIAVALHTQEGDEPLDAVRLLTMPGQALWQTLGLLGVACDQVRGSIRGDIEDDS